MESSASSNNTIITILTYPLLTKIFLCIFSAFYATGCNRANGLCFDSMRSADVLPQLFGLLRCHKRKSLPTYHGKCTYRLLLFLLLNKPSNWLPATSMMVMLVSVWSFYFYLLLGHCQLIIHSKLIAMNANKYIVVLPMRTILRSVCL